jgi:ribosome-associated heat shock protein Hsp15
MEKVQEIRADKWLWAVRIFKTRSLATEACKGNLVKIDGKAIKPSRFLKPGEIVMIEKDLAVRQARVLALPKSRVGAKEADTFREDLTPVRPKSNLDFLQYPEPRRDRGSGRPTKRERRDLEAWLGDH